MAKVTKKPPNGASRAQTQEYLFKLFKEGHPPAMALQMLKSAGAASEAMRASASRSDAAPSVDAATRLDRMLKPFGDATAWRDED